MKLAGIEISARGPDRSAGTAARERQDNLTKPPGSLGRMEEMSVRLCEITGR